MYPERVQLTGGHVSEPRAEQSGLNPRATNGQSTHSHPVITTTRLLSDTRARSPIQLSSVRNASATTSAQAMECSHDCSW